MKIFIAKILLLLSLLTLSGVGFIGNTYAAIDKSKAIKVVVTEAIPGANCEKGTGTGTYDCYVEKGFGTVTSMMGEIIKYFTFIAGLAGVLFIVLNGIMYSMGGMDDAMKTKAKESITKTIMGLILLFMSGVILNNIAPWIYK